MITLFDKHVPNCMRTLLIASSVMLMAACSTTQLPISPHKIDVQQGNVIDQETVGKLKPGLTRSQVKFLLGSPLVVDPFHNNRWDYVYNFRAAGKLIAQRRLTVFFDRDTLSRIETEGFDQTAPKADVAAAKATPVSEPQPAVPVRPESIAREGDAKPATVDSAARQTQVQAPAAALEKEPEAQPALVAAAPKGANQMAAAAGDTRAAFPRNSVVPPLEPTDKKTAAVATAQSPVPQPVALKSDTNADAVKPDVVPTFPEPKVTSDAESPVLAAVQDWAKAWSARDDEGYLAAYADSFKPAGGFTRAEWAKRRKMLLNLSKSIEVRVESPVVEFPDATHALVTFNQYYRSDSYHDAVVKQLQLTLQGGRWLIIEERVLSALNIIKKK